MVIPKKVETIGTETRPRFDFPSEISNHQELLLLVAFGVRASRPPRAGILPARRRSKDRNGGEARDASPRRAGRPHSLARLFLD